MVDSDLRASLVEGPPLGPEPRDHPQPRHADLDDRAYGSCTVREMAPLARHRMCRAHEPNSDARHDRGDCDPTPYANGAIPTAHGGRSKGTGRATPLPFRQAGHIRPEGTYCEHHESRGHPRTRPLRPTRPQASTPGETGSDRPATAAGDPLQALSARAAQIRRQHATDDDRPDDWAHRDPQALLALPPHQHPIRRALERSKEGPSRRNFGTLLRRICELLTDAEPGSLTFDDVLAYPWHQLDEDGAEEFRRAVYRRYRIRPPATT